MTEPDWTWPGFESFSPQIWLWLTSVQAGGGGHRSRQRAGGAGAGGVTCKVGQTNTWVTELNETKQLFEIFRKVNTNLEIKSKQSVDVFFVVLISQIMLTIVIFDLTFILIISNTLLLSCEKNNFIKICYELSYFLTFRLIILLIMWSFFIKGEFYQRKIIIQFSIP